MFRILTLDGGGARGYMTAYIIKRIKEDFNINFYDYFDLVVGTSTGSLIAGAIALGIDENKIIDVYLNKKDDIFKKSNMFFLSQIVKSKYDNTNLINIVKEKYENKNFEDVKVKLMITSTELSSKNPMLFKSWDNGDISLIDSVIASCSAPSFFDPYDINGKSYIDGSVWANNPSLIALITAIKDFDIKLEDISILSIGTGIKLNVNQDKSYWGLYNWSNIITDLFIDSNTNNSNYILKSILKDNYIRIDYDLAYNIDIDELPKSFIDSSEKIYQSIKPKVEKYMFIKDKKIAIITKKYNFIQRLAMKIFRLE